MDGRPHPKCVRTFLFFNYIFNRLVDPDDTLGAMLAAIAASFTVFACVLAFILISEAQPTAGLLSHNMHTTVSVTIILIAHLTFL